MLAKVYVCRATLKLAGEAMIRNTDHAVRPAVMNICFSEAWGGLEMSTVKMIRLFAEAQYESIGVCRPNSPIEKALREHGLPLHSLSARDYISPATTFAIRRLVLRHRVQAIFLHSLRDIWLVRPALVGLPSVRLYGFARMFFKNVNKKDLLHTWLYRRMNGLIALSYIQKEYLARCLPVDPDRFIVIPNGVDVERFQPRPLRQDIRKDWGIDSTQFLFGLIGRLDRQKGSMEFVEAAAQVIKTYPHARFVLVGGETIDGEALDSFAESVKKRIRELGIEQQVRLIEFRKDIPAVLNALDAFVMPSYEENFANVLLEALASGLPCIGTSSGGTPEILAELPSREPVGLLAEPQSAHALARVMAELLANPPLKARLQQSARQKALEEYDMKRVFMRIENLVAMRIEGKEVTR